MKRIIIAFLVGLVTSLSVGAVLTYPKTVEAAGETCDSVAHPGPYYSGQSACQTAGASTCGYAVTCVNSGLGYGLNCWQYAEGCPPPPTCSDFTYSSWGTCDPTSCTQTRSIVTRTPTGCTGGTSVTSQTCDPGAPSTPTVSAAGAETDRCNVNFTATNVTSFDVYFGGSLWTNIPANLSTAQRTGLSALTDYSFGVKAKNCSPTTPYSAQVNATCTTWSNRLPAYPGKIQFTDIKSTFRCTSNKLKDYYKGVGTKGENNGPCVRNQDDAPNVPSSGPISIRNFHNAQRH